MLTTWSKILEWVKHFAPKKIVQEYNDSVAQVLKPQSQKSYLYNYIELMIDVQNIQEQSIHNAYSASL